MTVTLPARILKFWARGWSRSKFKLLFAWKPRMTRPSGLVIWESGGRLSVSLGGDEYRVNKECLADMPCYQLLSTNRPNCSLMWIRDMRGDDISLSKWQAQRCWEEKRKTEKSGSENHVSDLDVSCQSGEADVGERTSVEDICVAVRLIYFEQGVSCDNETDDKWQVCSHAEIKWADGCKAESRDRRVDTCLASFRAEPEVTGRSETRRQHITCQFLSEACTIDSFFF